MELFKEIKKLNSLEKVFLTFLSSAQVYYVYRYILRYGSALSPRGYTETPQIFQYGKFILVFLFFIGLAVLVSRKVKFQDVKKEFSDNPIWYLILFFVIYIIFSLFKFNLNLENFSFSQIIKMLFIVPLVFFIPYIWKDKSPLPLLKIFLIISLFYHLVYNFLMIANFYIFNRLPGLAFSNLIGRFGGGWDDPNSFSSFVVLLILILLAIDIKNYKKKSYLLYSFILGVLVASLLYAFSVTGLVGFILILSATFFLKIISFKKIVSIPIVISFLACVFYLLNYYNLIFNEKIASSREHVAVPITVKEAPSIQQSPIKAVFNFLFGSSKDIAFHENFYMQLLINFGIVAIVLLLSIIGVTVFRAYQGWVNTSEDNPQKKTFFLVALVYLPVFMIMNIMIPLFQIFPINLFAWALVGFVWVIDYNKASVSLNNSQKKQGV